MIRCKMQRIIFYRNMPEGHISYCVSNISYFRKEIFHITVR